MSGISHVVSNVLLKISHAVNIFRINVAKTHEALDSLGGLIGPRQDFLLAILLVGQDHAIVGNCRRDKQSSSVPGIDFEYGIDESFRFVKTRLRFGELAEVRRGRIALSMRHTYISVGGFEREILVAMNIAAERSQILQRVGNNLHSDLRRTGQTSDVIVECYEFIS